MTFGPEAVSILGKAEFALSRRRVNLRKTCTKGEWRSNVTLLLVVAAIAESDTPNQKTRECNACQRGTSQGRAARHF